MLYRREDGSVVALEDVCPHRLQSCRAGDRGCHSRSIKPPREDRA
ncbi:Rieske 2Fe-2S domain-containing protein [Novosphingobium sp.]|nr:Rieske 2Fe-2S domain-containing protein [Novosphingobium sp.]HKR92690.1 Rieske 2Fe-2S domain-containing protein [Novosphingobium sp.]